MVEWDLLEACRMQKGFDGRWVQWIIQCATMVSFSVKPNGESLPPFSLSSGIRQGHPLSPYLFILVTNCLSHLMEKAVVNGVIKGVALPYHTCFLQMTPSFS